MQKYHLKAHTDVTSKPRGIIFYFLFYFFFFFGGGGGPPLIYSLYIICIILLKTSYAIWSRGQTDIYGLFCEFVAPPRKKNLITIFS